MKTYEFLAILSAIYCAPHGDAVVSLWLSVALGVMALGFFIKGLMGLGEKG